MIQIVGTCTRVETETVNPPSGESFTSTTFHVMSSDGTTRYVRKARNFAGEEPVQGQDVVLAVWMQPYVNKTADKLQVQLTAYRLVPSPVLASA